MGQITNQQILSRCDEALERAEKATTGPFHVYRGGNFTKVVTEDYERLNDKRHYSGGDITIADVPGGYGEAYGSRSLKEALANAELFAHARADVPFLATELRRKVEELREAMAALKPFADWGKAFMRPDTLGDSCPLGCIPESPCHGSPNVADLKRALAVYHAQEDKPE